MTDKRRLQRIKEIIEAVDTRAMATDGPVPSTLAVMTQREISEIYRLAGPMASKFHPIDTASSLRLM